MLKKRAGSNRGRTEVWGGGGGSRMSPLLYVAVPTHWGEA